MHGALAARPRIRLCRRWCVWRHAHQNSELRLRVGCCKSRHSSPAEQCRGHGNLPSHLPGSELSGSSWLQELEAIRAELENPGAHFPDYYLKARCTEGAHEPRS